MSNFNSFLKISEPVPKMSPVTQTLPLNRSPALPPPDQFRLLQTLSLQSPPCSGGLAWSPAGDLSAAVARGALRYEILPDPACDSPHLNIEASLLPCGAGEGRNPFLDDLGLDRSEVLDQLRPEEYSQVHTLLLALETGNYNCIKQVGYLRFHI